jgi:hypothetical protein
MATPLMIKLNMASQWDPGNFKLLDMSKISGYPQQMPPRYEKWLPRFIGSDGVRVDNRMGNFWAFFQLHPISDDVKDLEMKLFSATLHGNTRKWYDDLPNASITSMDQLEETFLKKWGIKLEDIQMPLKRLEYIKQTKNETVKEFHTRFENLLYHIPRSHRLGDKYLVYLYTNALLVHLAFLLGKKGPKAINDVYHMAIQIKVNIFLFKRKHIFSPETKFDDPEGTPDTLSLERLVFLQIFERREQVIDQQKVEKRYPNEGFQSHEEEQEFAHASTKDNEDLVEEREPEDIKHDVEVLMCAPSSNEAIQEPIPPAQEEEDEVGHFPFQVFHDTLFYDSEGEEERESLDKMDPPYYEVEDVETSHENKTMMHALPFNEVIQILKAPAQEEVNIVSYFPFQNSNDALFYDLESEEVSEEPLDVLSPSCYDKCDDCVDNIDEFIHVGKCKWDVIRYDGDPIYDIEGHFQKLPLQLSYEVTTNFDIWRQGDDVVADDFQAPKGDLALCSHNDFQSYLEDFDE